MSWWGYLHVNGSIQVKRFLDYYDISEADESDFVQRTYGPFQAASRDAALEHIKALINEKRETV